MEKQQRAATTRDSEKYIVRFPDGMRDKIASEAKTSGRSMNAEIVARLQQSFEPSLAAGDAQFLLAKWNRDLADAELENHTLKLHLAEMARAMQEMVGKTRGTKEDLAKWAALADEAIERSAGAAEKAMAVLEKFRAAQGRLLEVAEAHGVIQRASKTE